MRLANNGHISGNYKNRCLHNEINERREKATDNWSKSNLAEPSNVGIVLGFEKGKLYSRI